MDVEAILRAAMGRGVTVAANFRFLALMPDHYVGVAAGWEAVRALLSIGQVDVWTEEGNTLPGTTPVGLPHRAEEFEGYRALLVAVLPQGLAQALARGDDRDPLARAVLLARYHGLPVAALRVGAVPGGAPWREAGLTQAAEVFLPEWYEALWALRRLGIRLLAADEVPVWARGGGGRQLLTAADVGARLQNGERRLVLPLGTVVTPLAWDLVRREGAEVRWGGGP